MKTNGLLAAAKALNVDENGIRLLQALAAQEDQQQEQSADDLLREVSQWWKGFGESRWREIEHRIDAHLSRKEV